MADLITSAANPLVKRIRRLAQRKHRRAERAAVVHGIQPVRQAVEAGVSVDTLVVAETLLRAESARTWVAEQETAGVPVARLTDELFTRISEREGPTGLAAVIRVADAAVETLPVPTGPSTWLAVEELGNPGNLGTILRTADATGAAGVLLVGATADLWDPVTIKASMGAVFSVPAVRVAGPVELRDWARRHGIAIATTAARAPQSLWQVAFPERVVVLLGSEQEGLDDATLSSGDLAVSIPMVGTAESLNLAQAATVLLYEVWRQRAAAVAQRGQTEPSG